jgi:hypothetical protein
VGSGEWRVASGEWRVASGEWGVGNGNIKCNIVHGEKGT